MALPNSGGAQSAPNRAPAAKVLAGALANERVALSLISALGAYNIPALIVATSTSTTVDFGKLAVGDKVLHISVAGGTNDITTVATAGTLAEAAIVGDVYVAFRAQNLDGNNPLIPPAPAQLTGRLTGDGGTDF